MRTDQGQVKLVDGLKMAQFLWVAFIGFVTPVTTLVFMFMSARAEMNQKIDTIQLQNVQTFARQDDLKQIHSDINRIANDLSELNGFLRLRKTNRSKE